MSIKSLKEFIKLAKDEGVSSLKYQSKDEKFEVSFGASAPQAVQHIPSSVATNSSTSSSDVETSSNYHEIKSPFVGTFYAQSSPTDPAYVKVGDTISKGSVLCILEAMKIMNEIESEVSGKVIEICVENESLVEFGQTLFKVQK